MKETQSSQWLEQFSQSEQYSELLKEPVAYFSAEYALVSDWHSYAGGLGILAGDYFFEMASQKFPVVAIGLFYHQEYVAGEGQKRDPKTLGLSQVLGADGKPITVTLPIGDRDVQIRAWIMDKGPSRLFLLDTDVEGNHYEDRSITSILYAENRDVRLMQEIVLGIGGMRFLRALEIHPAVFHLNEGHSAFLALELIRHEMRQHQLTFAKAYQYARQHIVFTNHTLVMAGQELFSIDKVDYMLKRFAQELEVTLGVIIALGKVPGQDLFSMTNLALNMSHKVNAVSVLHSIKAAVLWKDYTIEEVTNGIYIGRWDSIGDYSYDKEIWQKHQSNKRILIDEIKKQTGKVFDENILLLGWARRMVEYKQPLAILADLQRFKDIAERQGRKVQIVFSGPLNESQKENNQFLKTLLQYADNELKDTLVFLPNYNLNLSKILVSGCDVWLNTPMVGSEACGTSGMKACLNGVLPLSTRDGWVYETNLSQVGWVVGERGDISEELLTVLEKEIVPTYYESKAQWITRMRNSRELILERFSASRMLAEYIDKFYLPILKNKKHQGVGV
ncbi:MAG: alpha-glucan family phosphorylase [bacterium]